jgi:predicted RNase H-like HicB family nuclease
MRYKVVLSKNEDGYTVHCPGLRGCWSQGATEQEALENISIAIEEYLEAVDELASGEEVREVEVPVG